MPYIQVKLTPKLERVYDVSKPATIGRGPDQTVQILSRAVSRKHATVAPGADGRPVIRDLGAGNGVKVNGKKIATPTPLGDGDVIVVGDISMTYRAASLATATSDTIDLRSQWLDVAGIEKAIRRNPVGFLILSAPDHREAFQSQIARRRFALLDFSEDEKFRLAIALSEAIENGATHGSGGDPSKPLQITFEETDDEFVMKVRDLGQGFDVAKVVAAAKQLDALAAIREREQLGRGLGIGIVLDCVDRVQFEGNGSCLHMAKLKSGAEMIVLADEDGAPVGSDVHAALANDVTFVDPLVATEDAVASAPPADDPFRRSDSTDPRAQTDAGDELPLG